MPLLARLGSLVKRLFRRRSDAGGVPPVGVRVPTSRRPGGLSGSVAVMEPRDSALTDAVGGMTRRQR